MESILGLLHLILFIYALIQIIQSSAGVGEKILWCLIVLLLPLIGLIIWYFAGPGKKPF